MKATIVIPTYNEADSLAGLVEAIFQFCPAAAILIVDDNSPDGTGAIADTLAARFPAVSVIHRTRKAGLGTAYVEGFRRALRDGAEIIFEMDADLSHDPADLPAFLEAARQADVVIGSRYKDGVRVLGWRFRRLFLSKMANIFVSHIMVHPRVDDYTSGYRCYRRAVLEAIDLQTIRSDGYAFQIEMAYRAHKHGFSVVEIPIIFRERAAGISKISRNVVSEAFRLTLRNHAPLRDILRVLAFSYKKYLFLGK
jgi:dolichol-phosphate mannosyltransferase